MKAHSTAGAELSPVEAANLACVHGRRARMKEHERDRNDRMHEERGIDTEESIRNRSTDRDAGLQRDGNLGNERNRDRSESDLEHDEERISER
jgi:hypothetical protein